MKRRTFIATVGALVAGAAALPRRLLAATRLDRIGLELYSIGVSRQQSYWDTTIS
jgi:hypothetical protein